MQLDELPLADVPLQIGSLRRLDRVCRLPAAAGQLPRLPAHLVQQPRGQGGSCCCLTAGMPVQSCEACCWCEAATLLVHHPDLRQGRLQSLPAAFLRHATLITFLTMPDHSSLFDQLRVPCNASGRSNAPHPAERWEIRPCFEQQVCDHWQSKAEHYASSITCCALLRDGAGKSMGAAGSICHMAVM